jgi:hypothetical protein
MAKVRVPLQTGIYQDGYISGADLDCLNMYPRALENPGSANRNTLLEAEGVTSSGDTTVSTAAPSAPLRGALRVNDAVYFVYDEYLYRVLYSASITVTQLGVITPLGNFSEPVSISSNGRVVAVVVPGRQEVRFYDLGTGVISTVATPNLFYVMDVTYNSGHFVYTGVDNRAGSEDSFVIFHGLSKTDVSKGTAFNALDFTDTDLEIIGDFIFPSVRSGGSIWTLDGLVYASNSQNSEIYRFNGAAQFAFAKVSDLRRGSINNSAKVVADSGAYIAGYGNTSEYGIYQVSGSSARKVSTTAIDQVIKDHPENIYMFTMGVSGREFIGVHYYANAANRKTGTTYLYDPLESQMQGFAVWHVRGTRDTNRAYFVAFSEEFIGTSDTKTIVLGYWNDESTEYFDPAFLDTVTGDIFTNVQDKDVSFNYINTEYDRQRFSRFQLYGDNLLTTIKVSHAALDGAGALTESTAREAASTNKNFLEWRRMGQNRLPRRFRLRMDSGTANAGRMQFTDAMIEVPDGG